MPKLAGVDRLARRMTHYRQRHTDSSPRFDQSFSGACEQQTIETTVLQKRFLENKAKKSVKKNEKRQADTALGTNLQSNAHAVSVDDGIPSMSLHANAFQLFVGHFRRQQAPQQQTKCLKRSNDSTDNSDACEPLSKIPHAKNGEPHKFSVDVGQHLEFPASTSSSQPGVKSTSARTDGQAVHVPSASICDSPSQCADIGSNKSLSVTSPMSHHSLDLNSTVQCKQEPDLADFADLEQCAAALEKDAVVNGHFPGLGILMGNTANYEHDTLKELINDLNESDFLDFEEKPPSIDIKIEDGTCGQSHQHPIHIKINESGGRPEGQYKHTYSEGQLNAMHMKQPQMIISPHIYNTSNGANKVPMCELSPAQTLKHMAEQHQQKTSIGMQFSRSPLSSNPPKQVPMNRTVSPSGGMPFGHEYQRLSAPEYIPNQNQFNKMLAGPHFDVTKQEMMYNLHQSHSQQPPSQLQGNKFDLKRLTQKPMQPQQQPKLAQEQQPPQMQKNLNASFDKQHFPHYGSPNCGDGASSSKNSDNEINGDTRGNQVTLQMKQSQHLGISHQGPSAHSLHVS